MASSYVHLVEENNEIKIYVQGMMDFTRGEFSCTDVEPVKSSNDKHLVFMKNIQYDGLHKRGDLMY